jgi:hypothetical protein
MKKQLDDSKPVTQKVLVNTLMSTLMEFWEQVVMPELDKKADKSDIESFRVETNAHLRDIDRKLIDQELDTPTKGEFNRLARRVERIEKQIQN